MDCTDKLAGGVLLQVSPRLERLGVPHGFTTRQGGVSEGIFSSLDLAPRRGDDPARVEENYRRVCGALGVDRKGLVLSAQVHRDGVRQVGREDWGKGLDRPTGYEADALITDVPGTTLVVFGADCLTLLLYDPVKGAVGAAHAGWRGTALSIAGRTVEAMEKAFGSAPADLVAVLGPCIGRCCFEVGPEVPRAMEDAFGPESGPFIDDLGTGKYKVDLKGLNTLSLKRAGVREEKVDVSPDCTMCLPGKYWSHRYTRGERGSQASLIALPDKR